MLMATIFPVLYMAILILANLHECMPIAKTQLLMTHSVLLNGHLKYTQSSLLYKESIYSIDDKN